jgi:hypothetical protein
MFYVAILTHDPGVPYEEYISVVAGNDATRRIKSVDIEDNETRDHTGIADEDMVRILCKYKTAKEILR